jgi:hypothetical protein
MTSLFMLYWLLNIQKSSSTHYFILGALGGLMFLMRWQDVLFIAIPFIYEWFNRNENKLIRHIQVMIKNYLIVLAGLLIFAVPQIIEWKIIYGNWLSVP